MLRRMNTQTLSAATNPPTDFDFIIGHWRVHHQRLNHRLAGCTEWTAFEGRTTARTILGGFGNIEDNLMHFPDGDVPAVALRSFDAQSGTWSIWWLNGLQPHTLETPVVGRFTGHRGLFFARDQLDGRAILVRFIWDATPGQPPAWEQAFSPDDGATWETNWRMVFERIDG